ncbi:MAG: DUF456 domain-containing protein [Deltaproteobacteria bacterium]|nr:DUF456 domain-containing protein [Deltaproteobacteria bacterium]
MILSILSSLGLVIYVLLLLAALLLVPLGFPGTWLMVVVSFVYSLIADFQTGKSDFGILFVVILLAVVGEVLEFGIGVWGGKKMSVSNRTIVASLIGGVLGAFIGVPVLLIGSILGLFAGVFAGAFLSEILEKRDWRKGLQGALACFFSRITAMFVKTGIGFVMVVYLLVKTF